MRLIIVLGLLVIARQSTSSSPSSCSRDEFELLHQKVKLKKDDLATLLDDVSRKGQDCVYEYITLNVTNLFLQFTVYDINNTDILCKAYTYQYGQKGCDIGMALPCRELNKNLDILEQSTRDLQKLSKNPSLHRRPVPRHNFRSVKQAEGYFYDSTSQQPLFSGGYDHGDYAFYYGFESSIVEQLKPIGQGSDEVVVHIATLIPSEGAVNSSEIDVVVDTFDRLESFGLTSGLVLGCNLPVWVTEKYPEVMNYGSSSCKLNTDHPVVLELWKQGLTPLIEKVKSRVPTALNSYRLGNEVFFGVMGNKTVVSNYTLSKWHQWLTDKYENITKLNSVWKKTYKNFDQIFFPGSVNAKTHEIEPDKSLIGGIQWYDYCNFNSERIFAFYSKLVEMIKGLDPMAKTHIKYVNYHLFTYYYCNGVDRLAMNNLTDWSGCDTRIMTAPVSYIETPFRNSQQYALDWLPAALAYTWMKTTTPTKPIVDLEVHPITTSKYRNGSIPNDHMKAVTWLIHLHGIALHMTWAWPRAANGSYKFDIVDTFPTLPQAVDGYGKALALINALGPEVLALANASKPVCMLWSRDSAIQDMDYLHAQVDTFEALSFYGTQPQFVAEPFVTGTKTFTDLNCKVLIIPGQQYVSDQIVTAVHSYVSDEDGKVVFTGNKNVFHFTPTGLSRKSSELEWLQALPHFSDQEASKLLKLIEPHLSPAEVDKVVACVHQSTNASVWGVMCRGVNMQDSKSVVIFAMNVITEPVLVTFYVQGKPLAKAKDMYMFETIDLKSPLLMEPLGVLILQAAFQ